MLLTPRRDALGVPMSDKNAGAGEGAYAFNSHTDALYNILESVVRGKVSECRHGGGSCNLPHNNGQSLSYPTPILWYQDIRPADLDAYHAANGRTRSSGNKGSSNDANVPSEQEDGDCIGPRLEAKVSAVFVERRTGVVEEDGSSAETVSTPDRLVSTGQHPSGPAAAAEKIMLLESRVHSQPLPPPGTSGRLRDHCTDEEADSSRSSHGIVGVQQAEAEEPAMAPAAVQQAEAEEPAMAAAAAAGTDVDGERCSKPREDASRFPFTMTPTTTPLDPSQATQTMYLPGLPSQVLMTQQRGDSEWENAEADESQQEEEGDTAASEHALSLFPPHPSSSAGADVPKGADQESAASRASFGIRCRADRNRAGGGDNGDDGEAGRAAAAAVARGQEESRSRQNEEFIGALRELVERGGSSASSIESGSAQSAARNGRGGNSNDTCGRPEPPLTFVSTEKVLPSGWSGGQAEVVAFLDRHFVRARKRAPDGYAVRALELACHVLRQPTVCVKKTGRSAGTSVCSGMATTRYVDEDQVEVVGVAGFVWEILRRSGRDTRRKPGPDTSQV